MTASMRAVMLLAGLLWLPGCATAALNVALRAANPGPAWNGEVAIATEPPGARCTVERGGRVMAEVPSTPGTVRLSRSHSVLDLRCSAEDRLEMVERLRPRDDPAVFRMAPNGIIGATATVISLAAARTMRYPGEVTVPLPPARFASAAARDAWFAERRDAIMARRARDIALAEERCRTYSENTCDPGLLVMQTEQAEDLARLDALLAQAGVATQVASVD